MRVASRETRLGLLPLLSSILLPLYYKQAHLHKKTQEVDPLPQQTRSPSSSPSTPSLKPSNKYTDPDLTGHFIKDNWTREPSLDEHHLTHVLAQTNN